MQAMNRLFRAFISIIIPVALANGSTIINRFDDLISQPVDGLVHLGVLYSFALGGIPSSAAIYGVPFPPDFIMGNSALIGPTSDMITPSNSGLLTFSFEQPTNLFGLAVALSTTAADSFTLTLVDNVGNVGTPMTLLTAPDPLCDPSTALCFSEATYTYAGQEVISSAQLNFNSTGADSFAIGTLEYAASIPEPNTFLLSGILVPLLIIVARR